MRNQENIEVASRSGKIAGNARKDLEDEIGESVVTNNNTLNYEYVEEKEIEMKLEKKTCPIVVTIINIIIIINFLKLEV